MLSRQIALSKLSMADFGVPYCYSPVIIVNNARLKKNKKVYTAFIKATRKGYLYAAQHPEEVLAILNNYLTAYDKEHIDIAQSLVVTVPHFGTSASCGIMESKRVIAFLQWLVKHKLENKIILKQQLFTVSIRATAYCNFYFRFLVLFF